MTLSATSLPPSSITASNTCLPENALNLAMAYFRYLVSVLIGDFFRYHYRRIFHGGRHASTFNGL
jgi:hypothetical protein